LSSILRASLQPPAPEVDLRRCLESRSREASCLRRAGSCLRPPRRYDCVKRRGVSWRAVLVLEPVGEACHSVLPLSRLGPNGSTSVAEMVIQAEVRPKVAALSVCPRRGSVGAAPVSQTEGLRPAPLTVRPATVGLPGSRLRAADGRARLTRRGRLRTRSTGAVSRRRPRGRR
jgi:hypothetical protein